MFALVENYWICFGVFGSESNIAMRVTRAFSSILAIDKSTYMQQASHRWICVLYARSVPVSGAQSPPYIRIEGSLRVHSTEHTHTQKCLRTSCVHCIPPSPHTWTEYYGMCRERETTTTKTKHLLVAVYVRILYITIGKPVLRRRRRRAHAQTYGHRRWKFCVLVLLLFPTYMVYILSGMGSSCEAEHRASMERNFRRVHFVYFCMLDIVGSVATDLLRGVYWEFLLLTSHNLYDMQA